MKVVLYLALFFVSLSCNQKDNFTSDDVGGQNGIANGCEGINYPNWQTSPHCRQPDSHGLIPENNFPYLYIR